MSQISVSVWTPKGGVGKTIAALHLADAYARDGKRVLLVDHDPQAGALAFARGAERLNLPLRFVVSSARAQGFDVVIHDHPPTMPDWLPGDVVVMPTLLDAASFLLYRRGREVAKEMQKVVIPMASRYRSDRAEQRALLGKHFAEAPFFADRAVFATAYGRGQTVFDVQMSQAQRARAEVERLMHSVNQTISEPRTTQ